MTRVVIELDVTHATVLRNVLTRRVGELDRYLLREGDGLDSVEHQLAKDVRAQVAHCLATVEAELPAKERV